MPKTHRIKLKNFGCQRSIAQSIIDDYYPGARSLEVTPINYYLFTKRSNNNTYGMDLIRMVPGAIEGGSMKGCLGIIESESYNNFYNSTSDDAIWGMISVLQCQGVFG